MLLSEQVAEYIASVRYKDVPKEGIQFTKLCNAIILHRY
jgi:hypothetical protein